MSFKSGRRPVMPISHYFSRYFYGVTRDVNRAKVGCKWAIFDFFPMMPFGPCRTPPDSDWSKIDRWVHAEIYAASWKLFTLRAEADRVLCQLVMYLTVFSTGCTKWNTAAIKSLLLFMAGLFIGFLVEKCVACQNSVIRFRIASFSFSTLLNA